MVVATKFKYICTMKKSESKPHELEGDCDLAQTEDVPDLFLQQGFRLERLREEVSQDDAPQKSEI